MNHVETQTMLLDTLSQAVTEFQTEQHRQGKGAEPLTAYDLWRVLQRARNIAVK